MTITITFNALSAAGMGLFAACIVGLLLPLPAEVIVPATSGRLLSALNPAV
ncbi:MAG: hypothetical protein WDA72_12730 [Desulfomonilia bacterium]|nr:hypothetical protein [Deltaproteobacteria bacterium]